MILFHDYDDFRPGFVMDIPVAEGIVLVLSVDDVVLKKRGISRRVIRLVWLNYNGTTGRVLRWSATQLNNYFLYPSTTILSGN